MASLTHLDEVRVRNQALVNGRELVLATPAADIEAWLLQELELNSAIGLQGVLIGDEQGFLEWAIEQLQRIAGVAFAFIGELSGEDWDRVKTIELRTPGGRADNFEYDLLGTPCSNVVGRISCVYPSEVAQLFPEDVLLEQMGIASYVGLPLFDAGGRPLGLAVLMDQGDWSREQIQRGLDLLVTFRPRFESILSNRRARRDLELLSEQLEAAGDEDPLARLARTFAHAMNVRGAFVAQPADASSGRMRTVARVSDAEVLADLDYALAEAQLRELEADGEFLIRQQVAVAWPAALELASFDVEACLVLNLVSANGETVGQLGLLHDRPLNRRIGEQPVVRAFCRQIAFELTRRRIETERLETERRLLDMQRTESLGLLAGGVAHDFNNLLVGVLGNVDLALLDVSADRDANTHELLVDIRDAARSAMQLCRQMLAYAGRAKVEASRFELGEQIDELTRLLTASIPRSIELVVEREVDSAWVDGDVVQIRQVVMNAITNAGDAIGERRGRIHVSIARAESTLAAPLGTVGGLLPAGSYVRVRVHDDGCGMDEATLARIFDPFFTTKSSGHGLGLAAMLGIVRGHGGGVCVRSAVDVGTSFVIYLPEAETDAGADVERRQPQAAEASTRGRVLVVDDDAGVRKVAVRMLERSGYAVVTANDGLEALAVYERERGTIDCVLLDLAMPKLDGIETMRRLRALDPELPVLISSGYSSHPELPAADACALVHKPYAVEELIAAIASQIAGRLAGPAQPE